MRKLYSVRQKAYLNNPKEEFKLLKYIFEKLIEIITERDLPQKKKSAAASNKISVSAIGGNNNHFLLQSKANYN